MHPSERRRGDLRRVALAGATAPGDRSGDVCGGGASESSAGDRVQRLTPINTFRAI